MSLPISNEKVKIVRAITLRKSCGTGTGLRERQRWEQNDDDQREKYKFDGSHAGQLLQRFRTQKTGLG
jgi:hypothetical protein